MILQTASPTPVEGRQGTPSSGLNPLTRVTYTPSGQSMNFSKNTLKRLFLANFIKSITVHPEKLIVAHFPPMLPPKKDPETIAKNGRGLSVMELAVPRRYLEYYRKVNF